MFSLEQIIRNLIKNNINPCSQLVKHHCKKSQSSKQQVVTANYCNTRKMLDKGSRMCKQVRLRYLLRNELRMERRSIYKRCSYIEPFVQQYGLQNTSANNNRTICYENICNSFVKVRMGILDTLTRTLSTCDILSMYVHIVFLQFY